MLEANSNFNLPYVPSLCHSKADCLCSEVQYQMMGHNFLRKNKQKHKCKQTADKK